MESLRFTDIDAALTKCMHAHPPQGQEYRLHPDAQAMADTWARMVCTGAELLPLKAITTETLLAMQRWSE